MLLRLDRYYSKPILGKVENSPVTTELRRFNSESSREAWIWIPAYGCSSNIPQEIKLPWVQEGLLARLYKSVVASRVGPISCGLAMNEVKLRLKVANPFETLSNPQIS